MTDTPDQDAYALKSAAVAAVPAPDLPYLPPKPRALRPRIALIGAGGIAPAHLMAYRDAGYEVAAICNRTLGKAEALKAQYAPGALATTDFASILADPSIDVLDITPHPADRLPLIEAGLKAGKHVLSQKPFVLDLDAGQALVALARDKGVKLAVNQNGRWSPHMAWMRAAVRAGWLGDVQSVQVAIHWNHGWVAGTPFDSLPDLILGDFGVHWFDFVCSLTGTRAESVFATAAHAPGQAAKVPLMAQTLIRLTDGQASLSFNGASPFGPSDKTHIAGTLGSLDSQGPDLGQQSVTLTTAAGRATPHLTGQWFNDGFRGAMGALLVAIEDDLEPENGAAENLHSLALCFAAIASRRTGREVAVGSVRKIDL
jgi:predicted dehydrogenase